MTVIVIYLVCKLLYIIDVQVITIYAILQGRIGSCGCIGSIRCLIILENHLTLCIELVVSCGKACSFKRLTKIYSCISYDLVSVTYVVVITITIIYLISKLLYSIYIQVIAMYACVQRSVLSTFTKIVRNVSIYIGFNYQLYSS